MANRHEKLDALAQALCNTENICACPMLIKEGNTCKKYGKCRLIQKTDEQLDYIFSPADSNVFLRACAGSGKTEVLGIKAAYEIKNWDKKNSGIAVLTFTNAATQTIRERLASFYPGSLPERHYVGTLSSFIQGYITQKFAYIFRKNCKERDMSFTLIDPETSAYKQEWLKNYKIIFPPITQPPLFAHKLYKRLSTDEWLYHESKYHVRDNGDSALIDMYNLRAVQGKVKKYGEERYSFNALKEAVKEGKNKFSADGFATFEDMEHMALICLQKNNDIVSYLARKFPYIMVDECQDLSFTELKILELLGNAGSNIHLIGDLNQAIYSFKDALPEMLDDYVNAYNFKQYKLTDNFRSTQKIVDISRTIIEIGDEIHGGAQSLNSGNDAVYIEYKNEREAIEKFYRLTQNLGVSPDNCVILVRTNKHKEKLSGRSAEKDLYAHGAINAIMLWQKRNLENTHMAFKSLSIQLQKWIGYHARSGDYHCPKEFNGSALLWRLKLRDILNAICAQPELCHFENITYSKWYTTVKREVAKIICENLSGLLDIDEDALVKAIITPHGTATLKVGQPVISDDNIIKIKSIHSVKGETYDAVLHMSTPKGVSRGYWENWLNDNGEERRCAYVAATRPRFLLCWAVPQLNEEQRTRIEGLGFVKHS